jgi:hypothetical protein
MAFKLGFDKGCRCNNGFWPDYGFVHDYGIHAYKRVSTNTAAVENCTMTDVPVRFNDVILFGKAMDHASVLQFRAGFHDYSPEVAARYCVGTNVTVVANTDIAYQNSSGVDESGRRYHRHQIFNSVTRYELDSLNVNWYRRALIYRSSPFTCDEK